MKPVTILPTLALVLLLCFGTTVYGEGILHLSNVDFSTPNLPPTHFLASDGTSVCTTNDQTSLVECYPLVFQPTTMWQQVEVGQMIPGGLAVRINMETGLKEARLMSVQDNASDSVSAGNAGGLVPVEKQLSAENDAGEHISQFKPLTPERRAELEAFWEEMMKSVNQEPNTLKSALQTLQEPDVHTDAIERALRLIEDIVNHIDFAYDMVTMEGLATLKRLLEHPVSTIRAQAAVVVGNALQNNPKVQQASLLPQHDLLSTFLRIVQSETDVLVTKAQIYALGCLLRGNNEGISSFITQGGVDVLGAVFERSTIPSLQRKCMTLLLDIDNSNSSFAIKPSQWCHQLSQHLVSASLSDIELALSILNRFKPACDNIRASLDQSELILSKLDPEDLEDERELKDELLREILSLRPSYLNINSTTNRIPVLHDEI